MKHHVRVLVVEDNADAAESLAVWLELDGHEVRVARDAEQALNQAERFLPHAVVLDLGLPDADGYELAVALRGSGSIRCVLALSGAAPDVARAAAAGLAAHLLKPIDPAAVSAALIRHIDAA